MSPPDLYSHCSSLMIHKTNPGSNLACYFSKKKKKNTIPAASFHIFSHDVFIFLHQIMECSINKSMDKCQYQLAVSVSISISVKSQWYQSLAVRFHWFPQWNPINSQRKNNVESLALLKMECAFIWILLFI